VTIRHHRRQKASPIADPDFWKDLERRFKTMAGKGLHARYEGSLPNPWVVSGADQDIQRTFKSTAELAADEIVRRDMIKPRMSREAISTSGLYRWLYLLWQEGELNIDTAYIMYPSDALPQGGVIEALAEASVRQCLRCRSWESQGPTYKASDWQTLAKEIAEIHEDLAWLCWVKRPKATGIRQWDVIGDDARTLRPLLERAAQMLLKSGLSNELSILLLSEKDPLKRWCEYISGGGDLRIDGESYEMVEGMKVESVSGRIVDAIRLSAEKCTAIAVKLT
jgi:hypothetical protein